MSNFVDLGRVKPGFRQPSLDAQRIYRSLLDAMARPGTVHDLSDAPEPPAGMSRAAAAIALTLVDFETKLWLSPELVNGEADAWLRFHCNAPLVASPNEADFAFVANASKLPPFTDFCKGDARYPDRSTTVVLQLPCVTGGDVVTLEGPGIKGTIDVAPQGAPADFWTQSDVNSAQFQLGIDFFLVDDDSVIGLPRTSRRTSSGHSRTNAQAQQTA